MRGRKKLNQKVGFSLIELIIVIFLLSLFSYIMLKSSKVNSLDAVTNRLIIYLKQTRLNAFLDDKYSSSDPLWHKQRWTLKFFRCRESVGGIYYVIYSDLNKTGHPSSLESLKDPLTKKDIYSSNTCIPNENNSSYVLLTQQYDITDIHLSCNATNSLGQISFGSDGRVYSKLSSQENEFYEYSINEPCIIKITHKNGDSRSLIIENDTGYIYKTL